jgi:ApbE superfamily uncharacterized protein (UPF0280 family)
MKEYRERTYRKNVKATGLVSFQVSVKETDLWVSAGRGLERKAMDLVLDARYQVESYVESHPLFLKSLVPLPDDPTAPPVIKEMMGSTRLAGVGPMASVAGAIAQYVGRGLLAHTDQVIVENGGDIFLDVQRDVTVSIFAAESPLSQKIGILAPKGRMPLGICTSSRTVGPSLSLGVSDAACVISNCAALADAAATALGNRIQGKRDLQRIGAWAESIPGILGCLVILGERMAAWGEVELVEL